VNYYCKHCGHFNLRVNYDHACWYCGNIVKYFDKKFYDKFRHMEDYKLVRHVVWWGFTAWVQIGCPVAELRNYKHMWE
jgi:hypothetical protein